MNHTLLKGLLIVEISYMIHYPKLPVMFVSIKNSVEDMAEPIKKMAIDPESLILGNIELPTGLAKQAKDRSLPSGRTRASTHCCCKA